MHHLDRKRLPSLSVIHLEHLRKSTAAQRRIIRADFVIHTPDAGQRSRNASVETHSHRLLILLHMLLQLMPLQILSRLRRVALLLNHLLLLLRPTHWLAWLLPLAVLGKQSHLPVMDLCCDSRSTLPDNLVCYSLVPDLRAWSCVPLARLDLRLHRMPRRDRVLLLLGLRESDPHRFNADFRNFACRPSHHVHENRRELLPT
mmetsp:Transcript_51125/g.82882  ORF Transcript_51125/g.82882 Transcript_51125/m.82882 type:complete len:202 (-) Transcript_51125:2-607(-)